MLLFDFLCEIGLELMQNFQFENLGPYRSTWGPARNQLEIRFIRLSSPKLPILRPFLPLFFDTKVITTIPGYKKIWSKKFNKIWGPNF